MNLETALEEVLKAYTAYYNINRSSPAEPFAAEAEFSLHDEQYFLIRQAKLSESDSREYVFFAAVPELTKEEAERFDRIAWETGLKRVDAREGHRNTDVCLVILADHMSDEAAAFVRKSHHYKSYRFGLRGWSNYCLLAYDLSSGKLAHNRLGERLKGVVAYINQFL